MFTQFSYFGWSPDAGLRILRFQLVLCMSHMMSTRAQATSQDCPQRAPEGKRYYWVENDCGDSQNPSPFSPTRLCRSPGKKRCAAAYNEAKEYIEAIWP